MTKITLYLFIFFIPYTSFAQKEFHTWYFGMGAGINFTNEGVIPLTDGAINNEQGCATISDKDGNLLFYSNGVIIWNRNHTPMPNGTGLYGHLASTQSALIVPLPGSNHLYYVFTAPYHSGEAEGYHYSIVDMEMDNGLGDLVQKNIPLAPNKATEKLTAVFHKNEKDIWIITHEYESDAFYCWLLNKDGISEEPIISRIGTVHDYYINMGQMKISPDSKKLGVAINGKSCFEVFDFENESGVISNPLTLLSTDFTFPYGLEFSPDGTYLYGTNILPGQIYQFDLQAGTSEEILQSTNIIATNLSGNNLANTFCALQLGPDEKIYASRFFGQYLSYISKPNQEGNLCEFVNEGVFLEGKLSSADLPNIINGYFHSPIIQVENPCNNTNARVFMEGLSADVPVVWKIVESSTGSLIIKEGNYAELRFEKEGIYEIKAYVETKPNKVREYSISQEILPFHYPVHKKDTAICENEQVSIELEHGAYSYLWNDGSTDNTLLIEQAGKYWVEISNGHCNYTDTIKVKNISAPKPLYGDTLTICSGEILQLEVPCWQEAEYLWQDGSVNHIYSVSEPGIYSVEIKNKCAAVRDSFLVVQCCNPNSIPNLITPNEDGLNDYFVIDCIQDDGWALDIYNRNGAKVYSNPNYRNNFNGANLPSAVYYYNLRSDDKEYKGWLQIMR